MVLCALKTCIMSVAYFTTRYPAVNHSFIRREVHAFEALSVSVARVALAPGPIADGEDKAEAKQTHFIVSPIMSLLSSLSCARDLLRCNTTALLTRPVAIMSAIVQAFALGRRSDSGILRHLIYVAKAVVSADTCQRHGVQHIHAHFGTNSAAIAMFASSFVQ